MLLPDKLIAVSIPQLARMVGISEATLYLMANGGGLVGARRIGKRIVVHLETFEQWLREGDGKSWPET